MEARRLDAGYELLDRQIVDCDGRLAGKVDDLLFEVPDDGSPPHLVALLSGPGTLDLRVGGRLGRWAASLSRRLHPGRDIPGRIDVTMVTDIGSHVTVSASREDLDSFESERQVRDGIIAKIPGSDHEAAR